MPTQNISQDPPNPKASYFAEK